MNAAMRVAACVLMVAWGFSARAEPVVRVKLFAGRSIQQCAISSQGPMELSDESGGVRATVAPGHDVAISAGTRRLHAARGSKRFDAETIRASSESGVISVMQRPYRGVLSLRWVDGKIVVINTLPLEDYVRAVVPCEMPVTFHPEALKAQAVVTRTIAIRSLGKHSAEGADFCDLTHCQVYRGSSEESPASDEAAASTRGRVLLYQGEPALPVYHSTCGGHTADANSVWPGDTCPPYLRGRPDSLNGGDACSKSPHYRWQKTVSNEELESAVGVADAEVLVQEADSAGRAAVVEIRWPGGSRRMTGEEFHILLGRKLGWGRVKSARFTVRQVPGGWLFQGRGLGHGVGMCQWGANARAQAGQTMAEILSHYFPGTDLAERR